MPWKTSNLMSIRHEFVELAEHRSVSLSELCRRFRISRKTAYKWRAQAASGGADALADRSRRPHHSPLQTPPDVVERVLALRRTHPAWGGRKIAASLQRQQVAGVPAPSTISHILRRAGLLMGSKPGCGAPYKRFEHPAANDLWQIDFKGDVAVGAQRCHPLTALDDHSRFNLVLSACTAQDKGTRAVQIVLEAAFRCYGLPIRINVDNGPPWGTPITPGESLSLLAIWWIRLGVRVSFSAPGHPQTNGKEERFHRSLNAEVLNGRAFSDMQRIQDAFDRWREVYNHHRPHEGIGMAVPADRYCASARAFPEILPPIEYGPNDHIATVKKDGLTRFGNLRVMLPVGLFRLPVALRSRADEDGISDIYFCHHRLKTIDQRAH
jgi:transposase InsO family protein